MNSSKYVETIQGVDAKKAALRPAEEVAVSRPDRRITRHQTLAQTSNVELQRLATQQQTGSATTLNAAQALIVQQRVRELEQAAALARQIAPFSAGAILSQKETRALTVRHETRQQLAQNRSAAVSTQNRTLGLVATAAPREQIASSGTLVNVTVHNPSEQTVVHPLMAVELPQGVRFKAIASAPPGTMSSVVQTDRETVEMVLPFSLVPNETLQIVIETTPLEQSAAQELKARAMPVEERIVPVPQAPATQSVGESLGSGSTVHHLHPRP